MPDTFEFTVDPRTLRIDIGMPCHSGFVPFHTALSLVDSVREAAKNRLVTRQIAPIGNSILIDSRSLVVDQFLRGDGTHLFWIDADMSWHPQNFLRLIALATQVDVVGAAYTQKVEPAKYMIRGPKKTPNEFGLVEVEGLGLGFVIMRREVVEKVAATKPMVKTNGITIRDVFAFGVTPAGDRLGEDMHFFDDIRAQGYTVWLDPMIDIHHCGLKLYGSSTALQEATA